MTSHQTRANHLEQIHPSDNGGPDRQGIHHRAGGARGPLPRWTGWLELWMSAATAFIIAGGSAVLASEAITSKTLIVALVSAAIATANDVRQQMKKPPVVLRKA